MTEPTDEAIGALAFKLWKQAATVAIPGYEQRFSSDVPSDRDRPGF